MPDFISSCDNFLLPLFILFIELIGSIAVLSSKRAHDFLIINMKRDAILAGKLLRKCGSMIPLNAIEPNKFKLYKLFSTRISAKFTCLIGGWTKARLNFGRYYDPSYQREKYDVWFSLRFTGPFFDPASKEKDNFVEIEQAFLVDMGLDE